MVSSRGTIFSTNRKPKEELSPSRESIKERNRKKLDNLVKRTHRVLFECSSVFPFTFFPSSIIIDENKVTIIYRSFFYSEEQVSILIKNIHFVIVDQSVLFATIKIDVKGFEQDPLPIGYMWKKDAIRAKRIIMGLIACDNEDIDLSLFKLDELKQKVEAIGAEREEQI